MSRVYNFSPGPATLPESVLNTAREELPEWHTSGMSVIEMSHRGKDFIGIADKAETLLTYLRDSSLSKLLIFRCRWFLFQKTPLKSVVFFDFAL